MEKKFFTTYDKYIIKQVFAATMVAILLFIIVWIAPEMLLKVIKHIITKEITPLTGVMILSCEIPKILGKAFPVGLLLGTLFTFDKLNKDSELTIFRAVGMSFFRILRPILVLSSIITVLCFITYDKLIPVSCNKLHKLKGEFAATQFIYAQKDQNNHPSQAVIVSKFYNGVMNNIIVMDFDNQIFNDLHGLENIKIAETGRKGISPDGQPCWILRKITSYDVDSSGTFKEIKQIPTEYILKGESSENAYTIMQNSTKRDRDINNKDMKHYVELLKKENLDEDYRYNLNKYYQRFLHPLVCILMAILGCLLGFSKPREQRLFGFTVAIGCIFGYYITLPFFDSLAENGIIAPFLAAAFPPLFFLAAIILFYKTRDL